MAASKTFSGARAVFLINSVPVAFAGGVSGEEMIDYEPVDVLALLEVREFVPVAYRTSLNAQVFRVVGDSLKKLQILPRQEDIITSGDLSAAIQDVVTRQTICLFQGVRCSGHSWDITARGIVQENVNFVSIRVLDEYENPSGT
jgi:predicted molibdopterin-dependent oxidoreductase YjgC